MRRRLLFSLALTLPALAPSFADEPKPKPKAAEAKDRAKLVGTWTLVSAKYDGREYHFPEGYRVVKMITPTHFVVLISSEKDGSVGRATAGTYDLVGETYTEVPECSTDENFEVMRGKPQVLTCKVEGNLWKHGGKITNGMTIEEVYERVPPK